MKRIFKVVFLLLIFTTLAGCSDPVKGNKYSVYYEKAVQEEVTSLTYEDWINSFRKDDTRDIFLKIEDDVMLWQYVDEVEWVVLYDFNPPIKTVEITFLFSGAWMEGVSNETVESTLQGESIELPTPFKTGYLFLGWMVNDGLVDDMYVFEQSTILTSTWEIIDYELTLWHPTNTELIGTYTYHYGDSLELPLVELEGVRFLGWYKDPLLTEPLDFETMPSQNLELFAKFSSIK